MKKHFGVLLCLVLLTALAAPANAMRIQNNVMALNAHRVYTTNNSNLAKSAEKLSSGHRANRAGEEAAGLAIAEKMRAQITGLQETQWIAVDVVSLMQTAEGALQEVYDMLKCMTHLAMQADKGADDESGHADQRPDFDMLLMEIDQIERNADSEGIHLLDGAPGAPGDQNADSSTDMFFFSGVYEGGIFTGFADSTSFNGIMFEYGENGDFHTAGQLLKTGNALIHNSNPKAALCYAGGDILFYGEGATEITLADRYGNVAGVFGVEATLDGLKTAAGANTMQVGDQKNVADQVRQAINMVSAPKAELGALQNRLEHKIKNLDHAVENITAAESRIRDVDMAQEMTIFTKNNILAQAARAMLAQANALPQDVLSLLQ